MIRGILVRGARLASRSGEDIGRDAGGASSRSGRALTCCKSSEGTSEVSPSLLPLTSHLPRAG